MIEKMRELAPEVYEKWKELPDFDWGQRPQELIGKSTLKAVFKEYPLSYCYCEHSITDDNVRQGKIIGITKNNPSIF